MSRGICRVVNQIEGVLAQEPKREKHGMDASKEQKKERELDLSSNPSFCVPGPRRDLITVVIRCRSVGEGGVSLPLSSSTNTTIVNLLPSPSH